MTSIDYLMAEDFEERFGFDAWKVPEIGWQDDMAIAQALNEGTLISITDEGMVMAGWRRVNITQRGVCPEQVWADEYVFLDE